MPDGEGCVEEVASPSTRVEGAASKCANVHTAADRAKRAFVAVEASNPLSAGARFAVEALANAD